MSFTDISESPDRVSLADVFLAHLANGEFERMAMLFEPDASLSALLPDGLREWEGPERITRAFVAWFGRVDEREFVETAIGRVGPRLQMRWRARVRGGPFGDADFVVEQHVYVDVGPSGRIQNMALICSGFAKDRSDQQ